MKTIILAVAILAMPALADDYKGQYSANPYATPKAQIQPGRTYKLYTSDGEYRGKVGASRYDSESVTNPYGKYGSRYSSDSIANPYGAGNRYDSESPSNPYGKGLMMFEE
jgi:hypothetical protein